MQCTDVCLQCTQTQCTVNWPKKKTMHDLLQQYQQCTVKTPLTALKPSIIALKININALCNKSCIVFFLGNFTGKFTLFIHCSPFAIHCHYIANRLQCTKFGKISFRPFPRFSFGIVILRALTKLYSSQSMYL